MKLEMTMRVDVMQQGIQVVSAAPGTTPVVVVSDFGDDTAAAIAVNFLRAGHPSVQATFSVHQNDDFAEATKRSPRNLLGLLNALSQKSEEFKVSATNALESHRFITATYVRVTDD